MSAPERKLLTPPPAPPAPAASAADWQDTMRQALMQSVKAEDIKEIAENLVTRAKAGDKKAIDLLFRYVLGGTGVHVKKAVIVTNAPPPRGGPDEGDLILPSPEGPPTAAQPGSPEKIRVMGDRVARGLSVTSRGDAGYGTLE